MTAFLRPRKPPFVRGEPGQHGDQWLMSESDLEEYAKADRDWNDATPQPADKLREALDGLVKAIDAYRQMDGANPPPSDTFDKALEHARAAMKGKQ